MKDYLVLLPIFFLLVLGAFIALQSGAGALAGPGHLTPEDRGLKVVFGNLSSMLLRVAGYMALMLAVQSVFGFPSLFDW